MWLIVKIKIGYRLDNRGQRIAYLFLYGIVDGNQVSPLKIWEGVRWIRVRAQWGGVRGNCTCAYDEGGGKSNFHYCGAYVLNERRQLEMNGLETE